MVAGTLSRTLLGPAQGKRQRSTQISGTPARVFPCPLPTGAFRSNSTERQVGEVVSPGLGHWTLNPEGPESPPPQSPLPSRGITLLRKGLVARIPSGARKF